MDESVGSEKFKCRNDEEIIIELIGRHFKLKV